MANRTLHSNNIVFMDTTDLRKLDVYLSSNLPTTQIYDINTGIYSPNWGEANLALTATIYLDSNDITTNADTAISWSKKIGTGSETILSSTAKTLTVSANELTGNKTSITYICKATYQGISAFKEITFIRVDTGANGSNGSSAPAVLAQYSTDGVSGWTSTLDVSKHKYLRLSYDGGQQWTQAIKIAGDDGTSLTIKGSYNTINDLTSAHPTGQEGDAYIVDGNLYIWDVDTNSWKDVGNIQGSPGNDGVSSYVFIRYADDLNGSNMSPSAENKKYIGIAVTTINAAPSTAAAYTWRKFVGDDAKSIILTADSQVFKVNAANVISPSTITVTAQATNTSITSWSYSVNGGKTFLTAAPAGVNRSGSQVIITGSTMTDQSIVVKASDGIYSDIFTVYKAIDGKNGENGNDGHDVSIVFLTNENIGFSANSIGQIAGQTVTSNVVAYTGNIKVTPKIGNITGLPSGMTINSDNITTVGNEIVIPITIANNATLGSQNSNNGTISISVTSPVATTLNLNWTKINTGSSGKDGDNGADAYSVVLSNESYIFPCSNIGNIATTISTSTEVIAYKGKQSVTPIIGTLPEVSGLTLSKSGTIVTIQANAGTNLATSGTFTIPITIDGITFNRDFSWSKSFAGTDGQDGQDGTNGTSAYFYVRYSANANGSSMTETPQANSKYIGTCSTKSSIAPTTAASYTWSLIKGSDGVSTYVHIRYRANSEDTTMTTTSNDYMGVYSGTSSTAPTSIDSYTWYNVKGTSGAPGTDAVTFQVYSTNGYVLSKDLQEITLQTFAYKGSEAITSGATYQWAYSTGNEWTDIPEATNHYLTITHNEVENRKSYKCTMTFNDLTYVHVVTVDDKADMKQTFTSKPSSYAIGDIWIVGIDYAPSGVETGTILRAEQTRNVYSDADWVSATKYDKQINDVVKDVEAYKQYLSVDADTGLTMAAVDSSGNRSPFTANLSNNKLSFSQDTQEVAYISNHKLNITEAEIVSPLTVTGKYSGNTILQAPTINLGSFSLIVESNGSLSIISNI